MSTATAVATKVSRADKELSGAVKLMDNNPETTPDASEWMNVNSAIEDVTVHSKMLELMTLRRIALGLRSQILAEPNPQTAGDYKLQPLTVDSAPVKDSYYVRLLARFNDDDFTRLLRTYKQKKMKDLRRLFDWSADVQEPLDHNGEPFLQTRYERMNEWRAENAASARSAIEARKSSWREFTPREITSEVAASVNDSDDDHLPVSEIHEIVRNVIRSYRQSNPECPPFITVNRGTHFAQVFIEQATPDDLASFVQYRRQQAIDMTESADSAQKLLDFLTASIDRSAAEDAAA